MVRLNELLTIASNAGDKHPSIDYKIEDDYDDCHKLWIVFSYMRPMTEEEERKADLMDQNEANINKLREETQLSELINKYPDTAKRLVVGGGMKLDIKLQKQENGVRCSVELPDMRLEEMIEALSRISNLADGKSDVHVCAQTCEGLWETDAYIEVWWMEYEDA